MAVEVSGAGSASLEFRTAHSGDLRTLQVWVWQNPATSPLRNRWSAQALAYITVGRKEAMAFLTDMGKLNGTQLRGGNASLEFRWQMSGSWGAWCLTVTKHHASRALRRFPLEGPTYVKNLAIRIADMLNEDQAAKPVPAPKPAPEPIPATNCLPEPPLTDPPASDSASRIAELEQRVSDLETENRQLREMNTFLRQYAPR